MNEAHRRTREHASTAIRRRAGWTIAACVLFLPWVVLGSARSLLRVTNDTAQWTSDSLPAKRDALWFEATFEGQDAVLASWDDAVRGDARLQRFAEMLRDQKKLVQRVVTAEDAWQALANSPGNFGRAEIEARLRGYLLGPSGRACVLIVLDPRDRRTPAAKVGRLRACAVEAGVPPETLRLAGEVVQFAAIDEASLRTMLHLAVPASLLVTLAAWCFLRDGWVTLTVGALGGYSQGLGLAVVDWFQAPMNGMLIIMPLLLFVICVSSCVHLIHHFREAVRQGAPYPEATALERAWFPCVLAAATTALGVVSLAVSRIGPLRDFGCFTSVSLVITTALVLLVIPGVLAWRGPWSGPPSSAGDGWRRLTEGVAYWRWPVAATCLVLAAVGSAGLRNIDASMGVYDLFSPGRRVIVDYQWLQREVGPLLPAELVVGFAADCPWSTHDRLALLADLQRVLLRDPEVAVVSVLNFSVAPIQGAGLRQIAARRLVERKLNESLGELEEMNLLAWEQDRQLWRMTVKFRSEPGQDYGELADSLRRTVEETLHRRFRETDSGRPPDWFSLRYAGGLLLAAESQRELLRSLLLSFASSAILITLTLVAGLRDLVLGVLSVLPNFFPLVLVFGVLGWMGTAIDMGAMMTSCIGLGIAVDDTVHYLTWYGRARESGSEPRAAVLAGYRHCGWAMIQTTVICGAGLLLFGWSDFRPAAQFGRTICFLLGAALAGDLVFLPALLLLRRPRVARAAEASAARAAGGD